MATVGLLLKVVIKSRTKESRWTQQAFCRIPCRCRSWERFRAQELMSSEYYWTEDVVRGRYFILHYYYYYYYYYYSTFPDHLLRLCSYIHPFIIFSVFCLVSNFSSSLLLILIPIVLSCVLLILLPPLLTYLSHLLFLLSFVFFHLTHSPLAPSVF